MLPILKKSLSLDFGTLSPRDVIQSQRTLIDNLLSRQNNNTDYETLITEKPPFTNPTFPSTLSNIQEENGKLSLTKRYECDLCDMTYSRKESLTRHENQAHKTSVKNVNKKSEKALNINKIQCDECCLTFNRKNCVNKHKAHFHTRLIDDNYDVDTNKSGNYVCDKCVSSYTNKINLYNHRVEKHRLISSKLKQNQLLLEFLCPVSGKIIWIHASLVNKHINDCKSDQRSIKYEKNDKRESWDREQYFKIIEDIFPRFIPFCYKEISKGNVELMVYEYFLLMSILCLRPGTDGGLDQGFWNIRFENIKIINENILNLSFKCKQGTTVNKSMPISLVLANNIKARLRVMRKNDFFFGNGLSDSDRKCKPAILGNILNDLI